RQGQKITYDVNGTTNYAPGVEERHGLNGMAAVVRLLARELHAAERQAPVPSADKTAWPGHTEQPSAREPRRAGRAWHYQRTKRAEPSCTINLNATVIQGRSRVRTQRTSGCCCCHMGSGVDTPGGVE